MKNLLGFKDNKSEIEQANTDLKARINELELSNKKQEEIFKNLNHLLKTPLNAVTGYSNILLSETLDDETRFQYLKIINDAACSIVATLDDVWFITRPEISHLNDRVIFNLSNIISEITAIIAVRRKKQDVEIAYYIDPNIPEFAIGDPIKIKQLWLNIIYHAINNISAGYVVISLKLHDKNADKVSIEFLAEIHHQDDSDINSKESISFTNPLEEYLKNNLAICHKIASAIGTEILVTNNSFHTHISLEYYHHSSKEDKNSELPHNFRVIAVDDIEVNRKIYKDILSEYMSVDISSTAEECLNNMKEAAKNRESYHLAIIDLNLPGINGKELAKHIKFDHRLKDIPLLIISGFEPSHEEMRNNGFAGYLAKPVNPSDLIKAINLIALYQKNKEAIPFITKYLLSSNKDKVKMATPHLPEQGKLFLLVEDNYINQQIANMLFKKIGYQAEIASNGAEALQMVTKKSYDLIFMDCDLPQIDGFEATVEIRNRENISNTKKSKIIALTANSMQGDKEKCLESGMDDYLCKPLKEEELIAMVKKWL